MVDTACAVITSGQAKGPTTPTDINLFHCTYGHTHEALHKQTAMQQGVSLSGELHECRGCSMAKGLRKPIARLPEWVFYGYFSYPLAYEVVRSVQVVRFQKKIVLEVLEALSPFSTRED